MHFFKLFTNPKYAVVLQNISVLQPTLHQFLLDKESFSSYYIHASGFRCKVANALLRLFIDKVPFKQSDLWGGMYP